MKHNQEGEIKWLDNKGCYSVKGNRYQIDRSLKLCSQVY